MSYQLLKTILSFLNTQKLWTFENWKQFNFFNIYTGCITHKLLLTTLSHRQMDRQIFVEKTSKRLSTWNCYVICTLNLCMWGRKKTLGSIFLNQYSCGEKTTYLVTGFLIRFSKFMSVTNLIDFVLDRGRKKHQNSFWFRIHTNNPQYICR